MPGSLNPASVAIVVAIGTALLAGVCGAWIAARRDTAVSLLFAIALLLILLNMAAAALIGFRGAAYAGLLNAALLLTAAFALAGIGLGLTRSLRTARATKPRQQS